MSTTTQVAAANQKTCTATLRAYETPARLIVLGDVLTEQACQQLAAALSEAVSRYPRLVLDLTRAGALSGAAARIVADHRDDVRVVLVACESDASRMLRAHQTRLPLAHQPRPSHHHPHRLRRSLPERSGVHRRPSRQSAEYAVGW